MKSLECFLKPLSLKVFFHTYWSKRDVVFSKITDVPFSITRFQKLLNSNVLSYPDIQCFNSEGELTPDKYCRAIKGDKKPDPDKLSTIDKQNSTIRISNLAKYCPEVKKWVEELQGFFGCPIHINSYYTNKPFKGLKAHYDPHHIFAVQLLGTKTWHLGDVVINNPSHQFMPEPTSTIRIKKRLILRKGEMLYLPPGMWHQATTPRKSLHITIGLHPPRWIDYLENLLKSASRNHPIYRAYLPFRIENGIGEYTFNKRDAIQLLNLLKESITVESMSSLETYGKNPTIQPKQATTKKNKIVNILSEEIWRSTVNPLSLYLRGSFSNEENQYPPWDIDFYLIVNDVTKAEDPAQISRYLENKYPDSPRIDLSIITLKNLRLSKKYTLKRLLLHHDGKCIKGADIKPLVPIPLLTKQTARDVKDIIGHFIYHNLLNILNTRSSNESKNWIISADFTKSMTKALLRSGSFLIIAKGKEFTRNLDKCHKILVTTYPKIRQELDLLMSIVKNEEANASKFIKSFKKVYYYIYGRKKR